MYWRPLLLIAVAGAASGQSPVEDLAGLIHPPFVDSLNGCGPHMRYLGLARSLADRGDAANPELLRALDSLERDGEQSDYQTNAHWWLLAYARINGQQSYTRFKKMIQNPKLARMGSDLDLAIALALDLTSHVSASRPMVREFRCGRGDEPRDALDRLLLGWLKGDRRWFESALSQKARAAVRPLWANTGLATWSGGQNLLGWGMVASVGYRLESPGRWGEPEQTLEYHRARQNDDSVSTRFVLRARFVDREMRRCPAIPVHFLQIPIRGTPSRTYLVDDTRVEGLLQAVITCTHGSERQIVY